jgi:hypothetical protein
LAQPYLQVWQSGSTVIPEKSAFRSLEQVECTSQIPSGLRYTRIASNTTARQSRRFRVSCIDPKKAVGSSPAGRAREKTLKVFENL